MSKVLNEMEVVLEGRVTRVQFLDRDVTVVSDVYPLDRGWWRCSVCVGGVWLQSAAYPDRYAADRVHSNLMGALRSRVEEK